MLTRWNPVRDLVSIRSEMDRMLDSMFQGWPFESNGTVTRTVTADMYENDDEVIVKAELPGLSADDVDINISGNVLTIEGEFQAEDEGKRGSVHFRERRYGSFRRAFTPPGYIDAEKSEAEFENGVLTIRLPKREEARPKQIPVRVKS